MNRIFALMIRSLLIIAFCFPLAVFGNGYHLFESDTPLIGFKGKPKFFLTLEKTASFVGGRAATTNEIKLGLDFKRKLRLGIGFGQLVSDIVVEKDVMSDATGLDTTVPAKLYLSFLSVNSEYVFYESKRWQLSAPSAIGIGSSYFQFFNKDEQGLAFEDRTDEGTVLVVNAGGVATYRILRWFGLSAGLGYRYGVVNNDKVLESFNSPVYSFRVRIFFGEIYKMVFPRGITGRRDPPYSNDYWD
ncbi:MAG: hypothetical protein ACKOYC_05420 [Bacteroidota bacterium]